MRPVAQQDDLRGIVREWLNYIQRKFDVTPRAIATRSGVSPSTIYRWLDENAAFVTSMSKLKQVADAFGEPLPEGLTGAHAAHHPGQSEDDLVPYDGTPAAIEAGDNTISRWQITSEALNLEGFRPGDVVEFDKTLKPVAGDVVVAHAFNFQRNASETLLRQFHPPYLLPRSNDRSIDPRPLYIDNERVTIMGTFVRMTRMRAA